MNVQTYSPSMVSLTFGGYIAKGWDRIRIARDLPSFRQINGIRGKNTRTRVQNSAATITILCPQTSELNPIFSEIVRLDEQYGTAKINIMVKDILGTEVFKSEEAYIEIPSEITFDGDVSDREWTIKCLSSNTGRAEGWGAVSLFNTAMSRFS